MGAKPRLRVLVRENLRLVNSKKTRKLLNFAKKRIRVNWDLSSPDRITATWIADNFSEKGEFGRTFGKELCALRTQSSYIQAYEEWQNKFSCLYPKSEITMELFEKHLLLITSTITFLTLYTIPMVFNKKKKDISEEIQIKNALQYVRSMVEIPKYYAWLFQIDTLVKKISTITSQLIDIPFETHDLFTEIYQTLVADSTRHQMGEFYTHSALAAMMVDDCYHFQDRTLDPACGSGMFLVEIVKRILSENRSDDVKLNALKEIVGFDRNPIACFMARANLMLINPYIKQGKIKIAIFELDSLFDAPPKEIMDHSIPNEFDLIIGNPPWVVLNQLSSKKEKIRIKNLGNQLNILCGGKLATATELTTIFLHKMIRDYLKVDGRVFCVIPASLANSAQHEKFRRFEGLNQIEFWAFDQDAFKIHNYCFKATKSNAPIEQRLQVKWKLFHCELNPLHIKLQKEQIYIPQWIRIEKGGENPQIYVGRLGPSQDPAKEITSLLSKISTTKKSGKDLVQPQKSVYASLFRQGASFVPRNLLFIDIIERTPEYVQIQPAKNIQTKKYRTWEFNAYKSAKVESNYIYSVAKSTGLLPFFYYESYSAFLPIDDMSYKLIPSKPMAFAHYSLLESIYSSHRKEGAEIETLSQRLDYGHALSDSRQKKIPKVIFAGIGSIVKGAILRYNYFIDTSLYYYCPSSLEEAYFLIAYLNSPQTTEYVKKVGSTGANGSLRNIHKHPLDLLLPRFDPQNHIHSELSQLGQQVEFFVQQWIHMLIQQDSNLRLKIKAIQLRLFYNPEYQKHLTKLDEMVKKIIIA